MPRPQFQPFALTIACTDLARSVAFYEGVLGAKRLPSDNGVDGHYQLGSLRIALLPNAAQPSPATFPDDAMSILWLETEDLEEAGKYFVRQGVIVIDAPAVLSVY
ncbi:MAG: VOC family protein [Armatimonas sp.]